MKLVIGRKRYTKRPFEIHHQATPRRKIVWAFLMEGKLFHRIEMLKTNG